VFVCAPTEPGINSNSILAILQSARLKRLNESAVLSSLLSTRGVLGGVVRTGRDSADALPPSQSGALLLYGTAVDGVKRWVLATHARVLSYLGPKRATQHITTTVRIFVVVPRRHAMHVRTAVSHPCCSPACAHSMSQTRSRLTSVHRALRWVRRDTWLRFHW
jgi:hypothetical protein